MKDQREKFDLSTIALHADHFPSSKHPGKDVVSPIHISTTFVSGENIEHVYSRVSQPTRTQVENVLSALEGGFAVLYSSGLSAVMALLQFLCPKRILIAGGYHGTHETLALYVKQSKAQVVDLSSPVQKGDLIFLETPLNPFCTLRDIEKFAQKAKENGAFLAVDSTFSSPILQEPLKLGAHFVMHSCTKFIGGHTDVVAGALICSNEEHAKHLKEERTHSGAVLGSWATYMLLRSLRTLSLRVERQSKNATLIAHFLQKQKKVKKVWSPCLASSPDHQLFKKQMKGTPPCFSFELWSQNEAEKFPKLLNLFVEATSLGGVESMIDWRYRYDTQLPCGLLRISIGIESPQDLIMDLQQAFEKLETMFPSSNL